MITKSSILLDTCILQNLLSKEDDLAKKTKELLKELYKAENTFYISEFSKHELLRGANETQQKKANAILDAFLTVPQSPARLQRATVLYNAYASIPNIKNTIHSISDIDLFIGSLIFTDQKPYLLTADYFDFPRPFFIEAQVCDIDFKKKKGTSAHIYYYLFIANPGSLFK